ncbi:MAG TPA: protein kinase [Acetobacteraceae bacterium]|nr:protein kinase [Acetobacteraceae bacterium]
MAETVETLGKYEIRRTLGKGAMGTVYEGWDPIIARRVAIKTVRIPDGNDDPETEESLARFRREAQAAGRLTHPNIVGVFDYGETGDIAYIVMEYVDGPAVKSLLDRQERFGLNETLRIMTDLLTGLQFSHARGVVHRDVKPANIMLTSEGQAKIADFGIARIESSSMTQAGTVLGTPAYMSPEQFMGQVVDARTDLYSSGVVLYQLLTGERPFEGGMSAIMHKALNTDPPLPSQISVTCPPAFDGVVRKAMAKRPEERFQSAAEFLGSLQAAASARPAPVLPVAEAAEDEATIVSPAPRRAAAPAAAMGTAPVPPAGATASAPARTDAASAPGRATDAAPAAAPVPALAPARQSPLPMIAAAVVLLLVLAGGGAWFFVLRGSAPAPGTTPASPVAQSTTPGTTPGTTSGTTPGTPQVATNTPPAPTTGSAAPAQPPPTAPPTTTQPNAATQAPVPQTAGQSNAAQAPAPQSPGQPNTTTQAPPPQPAGQPNATAQAPPSQPAGQPSTPAQAPTAQAPTPRLPTPQPSGQPDAASQALTPPARPQQLASAGLDTIRQQIAGLTQQQSCVLINGSMRPNGDVTLNGFAGRSEVGAFRQALSGITIPGAVNWHVNVVDATFCPALTALAPIDPIFAASGAHLALGLANGRHLHDGQRILPRLVMPDFRGYLIVDYVAHDGTLLHLYPQLADPSNKLAADTPRMFQPGEAVDLGEPRPGHPGWTAGPPYGTDMIIAIASSQPLFDRPRPGNAEQAETYLRDLQQAVDAAGRSGAALAGNAITVDTLK